MPGFAELDQELSQGAQVQHCLTVGEIKPQGDMSHNTEFGG